MKVISSSENDLHNDVGIGLRVPHYDELLQTKPAIGWLEIHSENYYDDQGPLFTKLLRLCEHYPISLHCVGLSLGSMAGPAIHELQSLKNLIAHLNPRFVSAHLCWSMVADTYFHDLLPLPYTEEAFAIVARHIQQVQEVILRPLLIENISSYLQFKHSTLDEAEFIGALAKQTGCEILLDINNLYVNSINHGWDPWHYLLQLPMAQVKEVHLAGFTEKVFAEGTLLIDTHNQPVAPPVWDLYKKALQHFGPLPTLIEWDSEIPPLSVLLEQTQQARHWLEQCHVLTA